MAVWLKSTGAWATLLRGDFPEAAASTGMSTPGLVAGDQAKIALYGAALVRYGAFEWLLLFVEAVCWLVGLIILPTLVLVAMACVKLTGTAASVGHRRREPARAISLSDSRAAVPVL